MKFFMNPSLKCCPCLAGAHGLLQNPSAGDWGELQAGTEKHGTAATFLKGAYVRPFSS